MVHWRKNDVRKFVRRRAVVDHVSRVQGGSDGNHSSVSSQAPYSADSEATKVVVDVKGVSEFVELGPPRRGRYWIA